MNKKLLFHEIVVLLLMFGLKYVPPFGEMTEFGMAILGIFVGAIYGWITIGMIFPNIAGIIALGFSGAFPSMVACFQACFGSDVAIMTLGCLFVCAFIEVMNVTDVIVGYLLNSKIAKSSMVAFLIMFFIADWLVSALSSSVLAVYMFCVLYRNMTEKTGLPPYTKLNSYILCGIGLVAVFGDIGFPFKATSIMIMGLIESFTGFPFSFIDFLLYCTLFQFVLTIVYVLIGKFILRIDFSQLQKVDVPKVKPNKKQKIGLWCILFMMIAFMLISTNLPIFPVLGLGGVGLGTCLVMILIQVDGEPLLNVSELAGKFAWPMYLLNSFFFAIAGFIGSSDVGITDTVGALLTPILQVMPPIAFLTLALVFTTILTNVLANLPVAIIFISTMFAMGDTLTGINLSAASLAIIFAAWAACATPAANPANAIAFANTDLIDPKVSLKVGGLACGVLCIFCLIVYYPVMCLFV